MGDNSLTRHEKLVLVEIVKDARVTDSAIAEIIGISPQAVGKIRKKLEDEDVIRSYNVILNPERIGLQIVIIASMLIPEDLFDKDYEFLQAIAAEPPMIECYKLMHGKANMQAIYSFRNIEESEAYFTALKKNYSKIEILKLQTSTWQKVLKHTKRDTYYWGLTSKEVPIPFSSTRNYIKKRPKNGKK